MSKKTEHLQMIQGVINRLADNSFKLKELAVIIASALFALSSTSEYKVEIVAINFAPILAFWILDGYFLWQERLFRAVYDDVRQIKEEDINFIMNPAKFIEGNRTWRKSMFSNTLVIFYGALLLTLIGVIWYLRYSSLL